MVGKIVRVMARFSMTVTPMTFGRVGIAGSEPASRWDWTLTARAARKLGEALIWAADKAERAQRRAQ